MNASANLTRGARRREKTRQSILEAAEAAFTAHGYRGTRMEDIADAADVAVGSIYGHFGNKDGLYLALAERAMDLFGAYLHAAYRDEWSPLEQVMACGDAYLRFHLEHPGAFRFLAFEGVETNFPVEDEELRSRLSAGVGALIDGFEAKIQEAMDAGEAVDDDARMTARFCWGAWNGMVALGLRTDRLALTDDEISLLIARARRVVVEGLTAPSFRDAAGRSRARLVSVESPELP